MTSIADLTKPESRPVQWIKEQWDLELVTVDPSFQRRFVWQDKHRVRLIETVLLGYAIPEIFLWKVGTSAHTGKTSYSIVDGQQRIRSLVLFLNGEFRLNKAYLSPEGKKSNFADKVFSELKDDQRTAIWAYSVHINFISESVSLTQIKKMFLRLNSTNMSLNPQELRHAEFDGKFIENAERVASDAIWSVGKTRLFSDIEIRRMRDVQFVTSILIYLRRGLNEELNQSNINAIYDTYNTSYPEADDDAKEVVDLVAKAKSIAGDDPAAAKMLKSKIHLYTLMVAIPRLNLSGPAPVDVKTRYKELVAAYWEVGDDWVPKTDAERTAQEYRFLSLEGVQKRQNRSRRVALLSRWLRDGVFKSVLTDDTITPPDSDEVEIIDGSEDAPDSQTVSQEGAAVP